MAEIERLAIWTVVFHTIVVSIHAVAHVSLQILPGALDGVFILLAYFVLPILSVFLFRPRPELGRLVFFFTMLAGFSYGFVYHYVLPGVDNVASVPRDGWGLLFMATTAVLALLEALGILVGWLLLRPPRKAPAPAAAT